MKTIIKLVFLIFFSCTVNSQEKISSIKLGNLSNIGFGRAIDNQLVYFGISQEFSTFGIYYTNLDSIYNSRLINENFYLPVGWLNNKSIILIDKNKQAIYSYNIFDKTRTNNLFDSDVYFSENNLVNDREFIICFSYTSENKVFRSYKYNIITGKKELIKELKGYDIGKLIYKNKKQIYAFSHYNRKNKESSLSLLYNNKIIDIKRLSEKFSSRDITLAFDSDGEKLYFTYPERSGGKTKLYLYEYIIQSRKINEIYQFDNGVKCLDLFYSKNQLFLTLEGTGESKTLETNISTSSNNIKLGIEIDFKLYLFDLN